MSFSFFFFSKVLFLRLVMNFSPAQRMMIVMDHFIATWKITIGWSIGLCCYLDFVLLYMDWVYKYAFLATVLSFSFFSSL